MSNPSDPIEAPSGMGPVPEENQPGHHPEIEQDKPLRPPPRTRRTLATTKAPAAKKTTAKKTTVKKTSVKPSPYPSATKVERSIDPRVFSFAPDPAIEPWSRMAGVKASTASVVVDGSHLAVQFGHWSLRTPLTNVRGVTRTGPYTWYKVAGPARFSLADGGVTFATTTEAGVCIDLRDPVPAVLPLPFPRHGNVTVTVADVEGLIALLADRCDLATG